MSNALPQMEPPPEHEGERRGEQRRRVFLSGRVIHSSGELTVDCTISDISTAGARLRFANVEPLGDPLYLINLSHGLAFKAQVIWRLDNKVGLAFNEYFDLSAPTEETPKFLRRHWLEHVR